MAKLFASNISVSSIVFRLIEDQRINLEITSGKFLVDQASAVCAGNSAELPRPWSSQAKSDFDAVVSLFLGAGKIQDGSFIG